MPDPNCRRARVRLQSIYVHKTADTGGSSEWNLDFDIAGIADRHRSTGLVDGSVISLDRRYLIDPAGDNLRIRVSGQETDWLSPNDSLPTLDLPITNVDDWIKGGQTITVAAPHHDDFGYSLTLDIRCTDPRALTKETKMSPTETQSGWHWCRKCQGMWFSGFDAVRQLRSNCPAGGMHERRGSGRYFLVHNSPEQKGFQDGWRWCKKCEGIFFGRNHPDPSGKCPAGGQHVSKGSGIYSIAHNLTWYPGQHNWRWCHKCEGLFFTGHGGGICPAGDQHDSAGSGAYTLIHT